MARAQNLDLVFQRNGRVHLNRRGNQFNRLLSRGVRISGQTMGRPCSEAQCESSGYPLQSPVSPSLPLPRVTVCHHVSDGLCMPRTVHLDSPDVMAWDRFEFTSSVFQPSYRPVFIFEADCTCITHSDGTFCRRFILVVS